MYILVSYLSFFARLLRLYQIIINSTLYFELEFKKKQLVTGPSLEGERGERWLPQVFGTYLIEFQKFDLSVDPY